MAHNKVTIDVEARFVDNVSEGAQDAEEQLKDVGDAAQKAQKDVDNLGKKKAKPTIDAENSKFLKKIKEAESRAQRFGKTKTAAVLSAVDKATTVFEKVLGKAKNFAGRVWSGIVKAKDYASSVLSKVTSLGKSIAGSTWSAIVKVKDYATTPLKKIKDSLFSIKTLISGIIAGAAVKTAVSAGVLNPINLADQYSSAKIGFSTLLGDAAGQKMMDDLDEFAKTSPFDTSGVIANAQKMLAMGWNAESIVGDMEIIGNAAASTGNLNQGLESIVRAMAQIKTKGKLSAEELNQLAEAGISAKAMLAEELGYGTGDAALAAFSKDQEDGLIGADRALEALLRGMKRYDGMMDSMANETAEGLMSQLQDTFQVNILRKWGQGLQDGAKRGLGSVVGLLDEADEALATFGDTVYEVGKEISNWAADKLEKTISTIKDIVGSEEFKEASLGGKIKLLWDGAIANPLAKWWDETVIPWWDNTVVPWLAEKAEGIGKGIGSGLTNGIVALLGLDTSDALEDGKTIGGSFMEGFLEGFDTSKITEALTNWAKDNPFKATFAGLFVGGKLLSGIGGAVGNIKGLFGGKSGAGGLGDAAVATMTVNAAVVNINGGFGGGKTPDIDIPNVGTGAGAAGAAGKTGFFSRLIGSAGSNMVKGTGITGGLASLGFKLTGGPAASAITSGGAAAALGGASVLGGIGGALGIGSGVVDIVQGAKSSGKDAKDEYFSGGTKIGMVGAGAAAGAAIGSVIPVVGTAAGALIGAGVGGVSALLTGEKAGKALSDSTDEGGALNNAWQATKGFFGETIPKAWGDFKTGASEFFGTTVPEKWNEFWTGVKTGFNEHVLQPIGEFKAKAGTFFTETIPTKWTEFWDGVKTGFEEHVLEPISSFKEKATTFFTETIPEKFNEFWTGVRKFFTEKVPYTIGYVIGSTERFFTETLPEAWNSFWDATTTFFTETLPQWASGIWNEHVVPFFTQTLPEAWNSFWGAIGTFFTETIPTWASGIWEGYVVPFFTQSVPEFFAGLWSTISTFFTETIPEWAEGVWSNHVVPFFTETLPGFFGTLWNSISTFFTETLPEWAEGIWNGHVVPFFTETLPGFFLLLWNALSTFFTETLPDWADSIWNGHVVPFFTESVPAWFSGIFDSVQSFFESAVETFAENVWSPIRTFFTETIPGWVSNVIDRISGWIGDVIDSFSAGYESGKKGGKARGGFVGGSSSMDAFARGGRSDGGIIGGSTRFIRVNEESPEMIIPLSSQRRDRALKLWAKTGEIIGADKFFRGGPTDGGNDEGHGYVPYEPGDPVGGGSVSVDVGGITVEINVDAKGSNNIVDAIKEQGQEIAEIVAGIINDALNAQFVNMPTRGGAY